MNRRWFIGAISSLPIIAYPSFAWSREEYLPCGQLVQFVKEYHTMFGEEWEMLVGSMTRRGIEYSLMAAPKCRDPIKKLMRSFALTAHGVDARDGLTDNSKESFDLYLGNLE